MHLLKARERVTLLGFAFAVGQMSGVSGSGVLGTCIAHSLVYKSIFLTLTHRLQALFSFLLEVVPSVDRTMIHIMSEASSHNALVVRIFLIVVLTPSVLVLICIHLLLLLRGR